MSGVIIACKDDTMCERLRAVLVSSGIDVLGTATKGAQAIRLASRCYDRGGVLLCTYAMTDMLAAELFKIKPESFEMVVLLSARQKAVFQGHGMLSLDIPINRKDLIETMHMLLEHKWSSGNDFGKKQTSASLRTDEEKQLLSYAKSLLMDRNNMSEPEAHRFMQKRSMDSGESMVEVAKNILNGVL